MTYPYSSANKSPSQVLREDAAGLRISAEHLDKRAAEDEAEAASLREQASASRATADEFEGAAATLDAIEPQ